MLHEAALGSVPRSIDDPITSHECNVTGFLNMLVAARDAGVKRFVYAASSAAYGDHPGMPKVEHTIGRPLSPYGAGKYMNELYADTFGTSTTQQRVRVDANNLWSDEPGRALDYLRALDYELFGVEEPVLERFVVRQGRADEGRADLRDPLADPAARRAFHAGRAFAAGLYAVLRAGTEALRRRGHRGAVP